MSTNYDEYLDVVLLIRKTTKIESTLENIGGTGGGIWEKADSISNELPNNFMQKIINIGVSRNDAIHGDLKVKNIDLVVQECEAVLEILESKQKLDRLQKEVQIKLEKAHFFDTNNKIHLNEDLENWIDLLKTYDIAKVNKLNDLHILLSQDKSRLKELNVYIRQYTMKKVLKKLMIIVGISIALFMIYIGVR